MLPAWLQTCRPTDQPALIDSDGMLSWRELHAKVSALSEQYAHLANQKCGVVLSASVDSLLQLISLSAAGAHVYLLAANTPETSLSDCATRFGWTCSFPSGDNKQTVYDSVQSKSEAGSSDAVTILTSGTTGEPKAVEHTWSSLSRPVRQIEGSAPRWLLTYRPHLYAGLQVILQCLMNRGTLVLPPSDGTADSIARLAADSEVAFASATPSYWRWLLTLADTDTLKRIPLQQITLGGEAVDQATLDALGRVFTGTRLVHIYATTELGRCFSVTDGKAGFPARFLDQVSADGVEMRIDDGELVVRSANAMSGYEQPDSAAADADTEAESCEGKTQDASPLIRNAWFRTGDLISVENDRAYFVGRKTDMINVGGNKVYPLEVERVIRSVSGVADTRVYGELSSIIGELVKCDLVVAKGHAADAVEKAVREKTLAELTAFQRPRLIAIVDEIPKTAAGKTKR